MGRFREFMRDAANWSMCDANGKTHRRSPAGSVVVVEFACAIVHL